MLRNNQVLETEERHRKTDRHTHTQKEREKERKREREKKCTYAEMWRPTNKKLGALETCCSKTDVSKMHSYLKKQCKLPL